MRKMSMRDVAWQWLDVWRLDGSFVQRWPEKKWNYSLRMLNAFTFSADS